MKTKAYILCVVLAICVVLFSACGKAEQSQPESKGEPAAAAAETAEPAVAPDEPASATQETENASPFVGSWRLYSMDGANGMSHEDIVERGIDYVITFNADGTQALYSFGQVFENKWTDNGDGTASIFLLVGEYPMRFEDGFLVIEMDAKGKFEKSEYSVSDLVAGIGLSTPAASDGEKSDLPSKSEAPELPYTLDNGLTISELRVSLAAGKIWSFGYTLRNPTSEVQTFDPSRFVLKNADGETIKTYAAYVSPDDLKPGVPLRTSINIGMADALNQDEEIYFFYDGIFLGTAIAKDF